jgi:hypothetical protein
VQIVNWGPFDKWVACEKKVLDKTDVSRTELRQRICLLLWNNPRKCQPHMIRDMKGLLCIAKGGDISQARYNAALRAARQMKLLEEGAMVDAKDHVKQWAVAMLDKKTQCTEDILRVALAEDFKDAMGMPAETRQNFKLLVLRAGPATTGSALWLPAQ